MCPLISYTALSLTHLHTELGCKLRGGSSILRRIIPNEDSTVNCQKSHFYGSWEMNIGVLKRKYFQHDTAFATIRPLHSLDAFVS